MASFASTLNGRPDLALLIPSYAGGGGERVALFLAQALAESGMRIDLVVARAKGELAEEPLPCVTKVELGALNEMLAAPAWIRYLRRARPRCAMSMIHTANLNSGIGAIAVSEVPVIVNLRIALECDASAQWWFRARLGFGPERRLYQRAARVVGVSEGVANEARKLFELPPSKVLAIPNPRQTRATSFEIAKEHEPLFDRPVILGAGRLAQQKDFGTLIDAFARVAPGRDLHLVILGVGPERYALEQKARTHGLHDRVFFPGFVANPQAYLRRSRVFALSSCNEGFPGVLVEAMEAGTAIVSTDCPFGPSEILDNGRFGRLVPVGDSEHLAAALVAELDAPDEGHEARRAGRADWMQQYDPEVISDQYRRLVRDVIAQHESPDRSS